MKFVHVLTVALLLAAGVTASPAHAGQDFPFFCAMSGTSDAFAVDADRRSPTGYTLTIYKDRRPQSSYYIDLKTTDDGRFWIAHARLPRPDRWFDAEILAYVSQDTAQVSQGEIRRARGNGRQWHLRPLSCR